MKNFVTNNRKNFSKQMKKGSIALFFNGKSPNSTADSVYPFRTNKNFFYLTGLKREEFILAIQKLDKESHTTLFIKKPNFDMEKWVGIYLRTDEAKDLTGIDDIRFVEDFESWFNGEINKGLVGKIYLDLFRQSPEVTSTDAISFADKIQARYPQLRIKDNAPIMAQLRLIKSDFEISKMKDALALTKKGLERVMSTLKPGDMEYQAVAEFDYIIQRNGADREAFQTIAASGKNATILHYETNGEMMEDGNLLLMDLGAQLDEYASDISRTYPINGQYSPRQKELYKAVLSINEAIIDMIKPGVTMIELNNKAKELMINKQKQLGLITEDKDMSKYYYHGIGHPLGLDTHDVGGRELTLEPGMVITVEPGLYVAEENVGIRIEDDVLVTETGHQVLSEDIIKSVEDIEAFMANK